MDNLVLTPKTQNYSNRVPFKKICPVSTTTAILRKRKNSPLLRNIFFAENVCRLPPNSRVPVFHLFAGFRRPMWFTRLSSTTKKREEEISDAESCGGRIKLLFVFSDFPAYCREHLGETPTVEQRTNKPQATQQIKRTL